MSFSQFEQFPNDSQSCKLPHPLRVQLFMTEMVNSWRHALGPAEWLKLEQLMNEKNFLLADAHYAFNQRGMRRMETFFEAAAHAPGSTEIGGAAAMLVGVRHLLSPNRLFRLDDDLVTLLAHTDVDVDIPVSMLKLPFERCYIELGQARNLKEVVPNPLTGDHILEGAYFEQGVHVQEGPGLYILMTGSGLGKADCMDDATHAVFISLKDPQKSLAEVLDEAFARAQSHSAQGGYEPPSKDGYVSALSNLKLLTKALLYISLPEARMATELARSELMAELSRVKSSAKRAKLERRLAKAADTVRVFAPNLREGGTPETSTDSMEALSSRTAHWRRGHFRQQPHGPKNTLRKLIFVAPVYVQGLGAGAGLKDYHVG